MALISRVLWAILFHLLVRSLKGQELTAEVLSGKLPIPTYYTSSIYDGKDSIYIIGGYTSSGTSRREILKLSLSEGSLTNVALLPFPRDSGSSVIDDEGENIYYFGGDHGNDATREIYKFNLQTNSVTLVGNLAYNSSYSGGVKYTDQFSSKVFLIGGYSNNNLIQCWDVDLNSNCPTKTIDTDFHYASAVSYGNEAFVFGNANNTSAGDPVYRVNLDTFEISFEERKLPYLRLPSAAVIVGSNAYIIGGWDNETNFPTSSIIQVDLVSMEVIDLPVSNFIPNATRFYGASAVYVEKLNRIYVIGGYSIPHVYHDEIWSFALTPISPTTTTEQISSSPSTSTTTEKISSSPSTSTTTEKISSTPSTSTTTEQISSPPPTTTTEQISSSPSTSTTTEQISSSPPTSTTIDPSLFTCDNKPDGFYPHPFDCAQFIGCLDGAAEYFTCQKPLFFNPIKSTCDEVNCEISCVDKPNGLYPHPQDCSLFIGCHDSALDVLKCPEPLFFDPIEAICNYPDLVECIVQ